MEQAGVSFPPVLAMLAPTSLPACQRPSDGGAEHGCGGDPDAGAFDLTGAGEVDDRGGLETIRPNVEKNKDGVYATFQLIQVYGWKKGYTSDSEKIRSGSLPGRKRPGYFLGVGWEEGNIGVYFSRNGGRIFPRNAICFRSLSGGRTTVGIPGSLIAGRGRSTGFSRDGQAEPGPAGCSSPTCTERTIFSGCLVCWQAVPFRKETAPSPFTARRGWRPSSGKRWR